MGNEPADIRRTRSAPPGFRFPAQKAARTENHDYPLNLSIDDDLTDSRTAWASLIELVHGKHAVTPENLAYSGHMGSWSLLFGAVHDKKLPVPPYEGRPGETGVLADSGNLAWATISQADLAGTDLRGTSFHNATVTAADFTDAKMDWADLTGADLSEARV